MTTHLIPLLAKLAGHRVLCVGDMMLDSYIYGEVSRISPEAPIPVMHIKRKEMTLGGAGNVVRNLIALGGAVNLVGVIGDDQAGKSFSDLVAALPAIAPHFLIDPDRPTTLKTRYVADSQQLLRADEETAQPATAALEKQIIAHIKSAIEGCAAVILSDYAKGVLTSAVIAETIKLAAAKKIPVLIDPKGRDFSRYRGATLLTPNRKEMVEVAGKPVKTVADAEQVARQLIEAHNIQGVLATLGNDGVCLVMKGKPAAHFRASPREVFDVSGAGDTVVAALTLALAGGLAPHEAAELANIAGAIVVGKIGTATVSRDELARELARDQNRQAEQKIITAAEAADHAERWRKQGLKVGFTNGCFDLLHPGHISLLRQARAACDKLIVGLNSDASIKRLKGDSRPVQNETARLAVLASLADVDAIALFEDDTPLALIKAIKPAVLVKGADYAVAQVVGGDLVTGWGGEVVLAKLVDGHSTTATIAKLQTSKKASGG